MQCNTCSPSTNGRSKVTEKKLQWYLKTWADEGKLPMFSSFDKTIPGVSSVLCNARRPDFFYDMDTWGLIIENDEFQHFRNDGRCELVRVQDIANSLGCVPTYILRYNPHAFKVSGATRKMYQKERTDLLLHNIQEILANPPADDHITIRYLFYDCDRCATSRTCSFVHTDTFKTMVDFGTYINAAYPLEGTGGPNRRPGPSASASHATRA